MTLILWWQTWQYLSKVNFLLSYHPKSFLVLFKHSQCLKIIEKVSCNMASEASYVYILSGQKFIKNAKSSQFGDFLKTLSLRSNSVTRHVTLVENAKIQKSKWDILSDFQTIKLAWTPCIVLLFWDPNG